MTFEPRRRPGRVTPFALLGGFLLLSSLAGAPAIQGQEAWLPPEPGFPRTTAETTSFEQTTSHQEMWDFMEALRGVSTEMRLGSYGTTWEGREIPYAIFSRPLVSEPWEAWALGRPIILLAANVHGGERTFREGLLVLMRELATPGTPANDLLDELVVLVVPQINPDGYEASERGTRGNAWGIDMNRDYVKLEQPALAAYVSNVLARWRPHLFVDSHNGGSQPYNLCYQCPSHADPAQALTHVCDQEIFPAIDARLATEGMRSWYYSRGDEEEWSVGGFQARIGRNYGGFVNSVGILFEAPGQGLERGARAGYLGNLTVLEYAAENAHELMEMVEEARMETVAMGAEPRGEIAVKMEYEAEDYPVDYTIITGGRWAPPGTPVDTIDVTGGRLMKRPVPTRTRPRPWAYLLPRDAVDAVELLLKHGITVEVLTEEDSLEVDAYVVERVTHERAYNHAAATRVEVAETVTLDREFPVGTYLIPTAQFLGRLVTHMLEPETDDNVVYWNTMDAWIPRPAPMDLDMEETGAGRTPLSREPRPQSPPILPIYKIMSPTPISTRLVEGMR